MTNQEIRIEAAKTAALAYSGLTVIMPTREILSSARLIEQYIKAAPDDE